MKMSANEKILIFDVETTGINPDRDQVIELSMQFGLDDNAVQKTLRFMPTVPISPEAQKVHGITMDDLNGCPLFADKASHISEIFKRATTIIGYNVNFDLRMIENEFQRARVGGIDLSSKQVVDPYRLWQELEPRKLENAYERFVGGTFEGAHSASADVRATGQVLLGMQQSFSLQNESMKALCNICFPDRKDWIGPSNHIQWKEKIAVIAFGKHCGEPLASVALNDASYLQWILTKDFPAHVGEIVRNVLHMNEEQFQAFLESSYPPIEPELIGASVS